MQYYGSAQRWRDIYEANRDIIADVNEINVGTTLIIP
jgi:nucleoid-associated protein YgaU